MKKSIILVALLFFVAIILCVIGFFSGYKSSINGEQAEQLASQLAESTAVYIMATGKLPAEPFNPFMQEGMFPELNLSCSKKDNSCLDKNFIYTGKCNNEKCMLNVAHVKNNPHSLSSLEDVDYLISMEMKPVVSITSWKRLCSYNTNAGKKVCDYLHQKGWPVQSF